jgi:hypothetical protein
MSDKRKTGVLLTLAAMTLGACASEKQPQDPFMKMVDTVGKWNMTKEEKAKYGKLPQNEARSIIINNRFSTARNALPTAEEKKMLAVALYVNFKMLQARAIPAYCKGMNVDISGYQSAFSATNRVEEAALIQLMESRGTSFEDIYAKYEKRLRTTAKYELMSAGSSYSACSVVKDKPQEMARLTKFSKFYPSISSSMR